MENIKTIIEEIKYIKRKYNKYKTWVQFEYQLDENQVAIAMPYPFENHEDSDQQVEHLLMIKVEDVYSTLKELETHVDYFEIIDFTDGEYYHADTLENTLKEFSKYFKATLFGNDWYTEKVQ